MRRLEKENKAGIKQTLTQSVKALKAAIAGLYNLAPVAVIVGAILIVAFVWLTSHWTLFMHATAIIMVVTIALGIFGTRGNFGEALLSLVGGLLAIFAFEWTTGRYVAFMAAWSFFAFAALLISSVKLAMKVENIYTMASLRLADRPENHKDIGTKLHKIASSKSLKMLGPVEKAEVIRVLAFRGLPLEMFEPCLIGVDMLSVITECESKEISIFLADFFITFSPESSTNAHLLVDMLYGIIKEVPVPPLRNFSWHLRLHGDCSSQTRFSRRSISKDSEIALHRA